MLEFLHVCAAIFFVGYVFVDAMLLRGAGWIRLEYAKKAGIVYLIVFVILLASGLVLAKEFQSGNRIFLLKMILLAFMLILTVVSLLLRANRQHFLVKHSHLLALIFCFLIVLCAVLMKGFV